MINHLLNEYSFRKSALKLDAVTDNWPTPGLSNRDGLVLQPRADGIVKAFDRWQQVPVGGGKAGDHEKSPDRGDGTNILWMIKQREGEVVMPGDLLPKAITVENTRTPQTIKDRPIQNLSTY